MAKPWEQQNESSKAFEAFVTYRDLGSCRSTAKVAQKLGKTKTLIDRWSTKHNWVERVLAWDKEQDRFVRDNNLKEISKMRKEHAELASKTLSKALEALENLLIEDIRPGDIAKLIEVGVKVERLSLGETTENQQIISNNKLNLSNLTNEELKKLIKLSSEVNGE